jgi:hypothetical protein
MEKVFSVYVSKFNTTKYQKDNISFSKNTTIRDIRKQFEDYNVRLFINEQKEVKVFHTNKYDHLSLETVWDNIDNGYILLSLKNTFVNSDFSQSSVIVKGQNSQKHNLEKYFTTKEKVKETIDKYGVAIIPNILTEEEMSEMKNGMWNYLKQT